MVRSIVADVTKPLTLTDLPQNIDIVVVALSAGGGDAAYRQVYLEGTKNVLKALGKQQLKRIFWVSSTSVYGENQGQWVDEHTIAKPATTTSQILLETEQCVVASGWPYSIVRLSGLYGPGRHRLLRWVEEARPVQHTPPLWTNRIHVVDAAGFIAHLCEQALMNAELLPVYLGVDNLPVPQSEVLCWLAEQMKLPKPNLQQVVTGNQGKRVSNHSLRQSGYQLLYPDYQTGYAELLMKK
jgi:nucleoside-diphosphate-sugar epimerase